MGHTQPAALAARTRRALTSRVSTGHVVMGLAGAFGVLLTLAALRGAQHTTAVLVAARDLVPGTRIDGDAVRVARVRADGSVLATLYADRDLDAVRGQVVTTSLAAGQLVTRNAIRPTDARAARRVMSFAIGRARAVDGDLAAGDHVDVLAVDHDTGRAGYVLTDAEVVAVAAHDGGALGGGSSDDLTVTIAIGGADAPRVAAAVDAGTVMLVRSTGAPTIAAPVPFVPDAKP